VVRTCRGMNQGHIKDLPVCLLTVVTGFGKLTASSHQRVSALGLRGKVLVAGVAAGVASARSCQKLPPCLIEPMPAGSTTDPLLAKAEPISDGGGASGITDLKGRKVSAQRQLQLESGVRMCERNNSADTEVSEEGGGGGAPGARAEIPLQLVEVHGGADGGGAQRRL